MFDQLGPRRKSLRFEPLENRVAPGVFLPFWPGAFEVDAPVSESVVRSLREADEKSGDSSQRRMGTLPVREVPPFLSDGQSAHPTALAATPAAAGKLRYSEAERESASPSIKFPAVFTPTSSNLLSSLFGAQETERDAEAPILKSRGTANVAPRGTAFGAIGGGANTGGGGGAAGDSGGVAGVAAQRSPQQTQGQAPQLLGAAASASDPSHPEEDTGGASGTQATTSTEAGLLLVDAEGDAVDVAFDGNTIVIGAATWCSACAQFKQLVSDPAAMAQIEGLRLVFAFGDEGGNGPGGVLHEEYLAGLPGDVLFLGEGSVTPESFPSAFNATTGQFDQHPSDAIQDWWLANTPQGREAAAAMGATGSASAGGASDNTGRASGTLALVDAAGNPFVLADDANTLVVGAATWCGATQKFVAALRTPEVTAQLEGLRIVFAFDNEGGDGPGGVLDAEFLNDLPGEVAFLARGSVRPEKLPSVYDSATGQFNLSAVDAINAWAAGELVTGGMCGNRNLGERSEVRGQERAERVALALPVRMWVVPEALA